MSKNTVWKLVRIKIIAEGSFVCYAIKVASATVNSFPRDSCLACFLQSISSGPRALPFHLLHLFKSQEVRKTQFSESCVNLLVTESSCKRKSPTLTKTKWWNHCYKCSEGPMKEACGRHLPQNWTCLSKGRCLQKRCMPLIQSASKAHLNKFIVIIKYIINLKYLLTSTDRFWCRQLNCKHLKLSKMEVMPSFYNSVMVKGESSNQRCQVHGTHKGRTWGSWRNVMCETRGDADPYLQQSLRSSQESCVMVLELRAWIPLKTNFRMRH